MVGKESTKSGGTRCQLDIWSGKGSFTLSGSSLKILGDMPEVMLDS